MSALYLLLVILRFLQFQLGVADEAREKFLHPFWAETLSLGHPQGSEDGGGAPLKAHIHHRRWEIERNR